MDFYWWPLTLTKQFQGMMVTAADLQYAIEASKYLVQGELDKEERVGGRGLVIVQYSCSELPRPQHSQAGRQADKGNKFSLSTSTSLPPPLPYWLTYRTVSNRRCTDR